MKITISPSTGINRRYSFVLWADGHGIAATTRRHRFLWIPRGHHVMHSVRQRRPEGRFGTFDWGMRP